MRSETLEKIKALMGGYFWLPCPMCGKKFGGHEKGSDMLDPNDLFRGRMTCADPECMKRVNEHNKPIREMREKRFQEFVKQ
jgi:hypothetical protein